MTFNAKIDPEKVLNKFSTDPKKELDRGCVQEQSFCSTVGIEVITIRLDTSGGAVTSTSQWRQFFGQHYGFFILSGSTTVRLATYRVRDGSTDHSFVANTGLLFKLPACAPKLYARMTSGTTATLTLIMFKDPRAIFYLPFSYDSTGAIIDPATQATLNSILVNLKGTAADATTNPLETWSVRQILEILYYAGFRNADGSRSIHVDTGLFGWTIARTTVALGGSATFTSDIALKYVWGSATSPAQGSYQALGFNLIRWAVFTDQAGTVRPQASYDTGTYRNLGDTAIVASTYASGSSDAQANRVTRIQYVNGVTAQGSLEFQADVVAK